jgi:hypothetical protein
MRSTHLSTALYKSVSVRVRSSKTARAPGESSHFVTFRSDATLRRGSSVKADATWGNQCCASAKLRGSSSTKGTHLGGGASNSGP